MKAPGSDRSARHLAHFLWTALKQIRPCTCKRGAQRQKEKSGSGCVRVGAVRGRGRARRGGGHMHKVFPYGHTICVAFGRAGGLGLHCGRVASQGACAGDRDDAGARARCVRVDSLLGGGGRAHALRRLGGVERRREFPALGRSEEIGLRQVFYARQR